MLDAGVNEKGKKLTTKEKMMYTNRINAQNSRAKKKYELDCL